MSRVTVLGGCGAVGRVAVKTLAAHEAFDEVVIADRARERAEAMAAELGDGVTARALDVEDGAALRRAVGDGDVVLNCTGPFYKYEKPILEAVIDAGVNYVDVCDDVDATYDALALDEAAKKAGVSALLGCGSSPGVTNLLARFAADHLLEQTEAVDIYHAHGGEPIEGEGVIAHRFHCMSIDVPMYLEGQLEQVGFFSEAGLALRERVSLHLLGDDIEVFPYPHPEQVTIPQHLSLRQVTNKGTVLPEAYYHLILEMVRLGLHTTEPLSVKGQTVVPYDVAIAWILKERDRILKEVRFGAQRGCVKVVVRGRKRGEPRGYVFSMASVDQALGEGTGIPAAMGAILMLGGQVQGPGVAPPEACVNPLDFLALIAPVLSSSKQQGSYEGLRVEQIDAQGQVETVDLSAFGL